MKATIAILALLVVGSAFGAERTFVQQCDGFGRCQWVEVFPVSLEGQPPAAKVETKATTTVTYSSPPMAVYAAPSLGQRLDAIDQCRPIRRAVVALVTLPFRLLRRF